MERLDRETQLFAVEKVLEEIKRAENYLRDWNVGWYEQYLDAYSTSLYNTGMADVEAIERKYQKLYKLANVYHPETKIGIPLKKAVLEDYCGNQYECEFGRIDWIGMKSKKATRSFSFNNNGVIKYDKIAKSVKNTKGYSYSASYSVLNDDFDLRLSYYDSMKKDDSYLSISLKDSILTEKLEDIEIKRNLATEELTAKVNGQEYGPIVSKLLRGKVERKAKEVVGAIRGEIPLVGLVDRLDNYLRLVDKEQIIRKESSLNKRTRKN